MNRTLAFWQLLGKFWGKSASNTLVKKDDSKFDYILAAMPTNAMPFSGKQNDHP